MRITPNNEEQWELKKKYDTAFDKLFLKQDFKFYATSILKRCPNGLDLDTQMYEEDHEIYFRCVCKLYGYDFSSTDRVIGDYYFGDDTTEEMLQVCLDYMKEKNPALYDEIKDIPMYHD